jgi:double-stranded uracil-DNA glycosylase
MSAWTGHHFARPGNRFWPALHASGFTPRRFAPSEQDGVLALGFGLTNLAGRATARADELSREELVAGGERLRARIGACRPAWLAVLGVSAYRVAFGDRRAQVGPQDQAVGGARVWVLPSPSGLNALWTTPKLTDAFRVFRLVTGLPDTSCADGPADRSSHLVAPGDSYGYGCPARAASAGIAAMFSGLRSARTRPLGRRRSVHGITSSGVTM